MTNCYEHTFITKQDLSSNQVKQVVSKVRWREIIENMVKNGITSFIEIGPGNVLSNLVKRISGSSNIISISKVEDLEKLNTIVL